jgi:hypothetical protein
VLVGFDCQQDSLLIGGDHDVGRFDVAVQQSTIVRMVVAAKPISTDTQGELEFGNNCDPVSRW